MKLSKKNADKLFRIFSIVLLIDFILLPIALSYFDNTQKCDYSLTECIFLSLVPIVIFSFFWIAICFQINLLFYKTESEKKLIRSKKFSLSKIFLKNYEYVSNVHNSSIIKKPIIYIFIIVCFGILWIFFKQVTLLIKLL